MIKNIYQTGKGVTLINENNYPMDIQHYLDNETKELENLIKYYKVLVEVGCMSGRFLDFAIQYDKFYVGIDVVTSYIDDAKDNCKSKGYEKKSLIMVESAENIDEINNKLTGMGFSKNEILYFFPFNSFGNMDNITEIVDVINKNQLNIFISTYSLDAYSTSVREAYYKNCNVNNLVKTELDEMVIFSSDDGLCARAYSEKWMNNKFSSCYKSTIKKLGGIGRAYLFFTS